MTENQQFLSTQNYLDLTPSQQQLLADMQREYAEGMRLLNTIDRSVTVYGGSKILPSHPDYEQIREIGAFFAKLGWWVVTGGGPGAMTAALEGARSAGGKTAAFRIDLVRDEPQVFQADLDYLCTYFPARKYLLRQADVFVVVPGGWGTLDELVELINLMKTKKYPVKPIFLYKRSFWQEFLQWIERTLYQEYALVTEESLSFYNLIDSVSELEAELVSKFKPLVRPELVN